MNILIAADMEGVCGVVSWDHVNPDHKEYSRFRQLMTAEVNAAVRGACDAGAETVLIADGHAAGRNILIEDLDPRAQLHSGTPSPLGMVAGADAGVDGTLFIGYHARAGTEHAILDHTWSSQRVSNLWLSGDLVGETGLNAALCGHFDVPVLMVCGDKAVCDEATALLGNVKTVAVKEATARTAAHCLPPEAAQERIYEAARRAVTRLRDGDAPQPFRLSTPTTLTIQFPKSDMADRAALLPGAERDERRITCTAEDILVAFRAMRSALALAAG
ncbi:MAG: M55 family metallopeptidase [Chloroflexota bacterium]|nr:M55 family metallopeptidase [Chloroflexota bacterium]